MIVCMACIGLQVIELNCWIHGSGEVNGLETGVSLPPPLTEIGQSEQLKLLLKQ